MIFSLVAMTGLEKCCITSAYLQWLCHSGERPVARGPLVLRLQYTKYWQSYAPLKISVNFLFLAYSYGIHPVKLGVVGCGEGVTYPTSPGHPTDIGLQLGKACYPCSR